MKNKTDVNYQGFTTFLIVMIAIAEFIVIIVLALQIKEAYEEIDLKSREYVNKSLLKFEMLPKHIQQKYRLKKPDNLLNNAQAISDNEDKIEFRKEDIQYIDNKKIVLIKEVKCTDMYPGSSDISNACFNDLRRFFNASNKEMVFEIIPLVQSKDLIDLGKVVNLLSDDEYQKYYLNKNIINNFTKYTRDGLAQHRVQEGILQIRNSIGKDAKIKFSPFHKFSNEQSGFTIRAYNVL